METPTHTGTRWSSKVSPSSCALSLFLGLLVLSGCGSDGAETTISAGGATATGGRSGTGGGGGGATGGGSGGARTGSGGVLGLGGASAASGGAQATGGSHASGGVSSTGGRDGSGGAKTDAGANAGGSSGSGGMPAKDGGPGAGGAGSGGSYGRTDASPTGGATATGGGTGSGGSTGGQGPCDIYQAANTPCVAAHSTVRALYAAYGGPLYQLRRASDKTTKDVPALAPGGFADISVQDAFCTGTTCTIAIIYDQTSNHNDLAKSPKAYWLSNGGNEANAADGKHTVGGHVVHGIYVTGYSSNVAYRNNATKGMPKNDEAEAMYMVVDGKRYSDQCCFDYGNAETSGNDDGNGTMEAVYFGNDITWGGKGEGNGPWIAADLENGVFKCDKGGWQSQSIQVPSAKSITAPYVTAMLKGPSGNHFTLKGGNAQSGNLTTMWDGVRPSPGYSPKKLQGAIILGTGGDGSNGGTGTFFEGAMTKGNPPDSVDEAIQANIVAAGYGR
jgi:hypothetical protein